MAKPKPCILVAGGAGYIGSHFCYAAAKAGFTPVVFDRISCGSKRVEAFRREIVKPFGLELADVGDAKAVRAALDRHKPVAVVYFAALVDVAESVTKPDLYWENNFTKAARFFETLRSANVNKLVFSSSAAVYGAPRMSRALLESDELDPIHAYGASKLGCEVMLQDPSPSPTFATTLESRVGEVKRFPELKSVVFRYFNAAGGSKDMGEMHEPETHLIPNALFAAEGQREYASGKTFTILGTDYPTKDGTSVRDYVHVNDLAEAHVAGLKYLLDGGANDVFNLGTSRGHSVRDVIDAVRKVTKKDFPVKQGARRDGDCPLLVANASKAAEKLGWKPKLGLPEIIESAWRFHRKHG